MLEQVGATGEDMNRSDAKRDDTPELNKSAGAIVFVIDDPSDELENATCVLYIKATIKLMCKEQFRRDYCDFSKSGL